MAIRVVDGVLGAGKTYFIVNWLVNNFAKELKDGGYVLDPEKKIRVITNVDGLKLPHESFHAALEKAGGFANFFTKEYQESFAGEYRLIYILDEAQEWFRPKYCKLTHETLLYFEWSRHCAHDIWLITQDVKKISPEVSCLCEFIVSAQPRTLSIAGEMTYRSRTYLGVDLETYRLLYSSKIASLYKSANNQEAVQIKNPIWRRYMLALLVALVLFAVGFKYSFSYWNHFMNPEEEKKKSAAASPSPSSAPTAAASSASSPASAAASAAASLPKPSEPSVEFYMYRLDHAVFKDGVRFLLGITWISPHEFPYTFIKKGNVYFAMIPAVLLPALENNARALPIRTKN